MISGIGGFLKPQSPGVQIIGCSPQNSQVMIQSVKAGRILDLPSLPTLSDGTAGGIEPGSITLDLCREFVDDYITVTEEEIKDSLREFIQTQHMLIEGSAAVAVAAFKKQADRFSGIIGDAVARIGTGLHIDELLIMREEFANMIRENSERLIDRLFTGRSLERVAVIRPHLTLKINREGFRIA